MWLKQTSDDRLILATVYRSYATELYSVEKVAEKGVISSHRDVQRG
jgi:hypothetical protein